MSGSPLCLVALKPRAYGEADVATRVDGAELLEQALAEGRDADDDSDLEDLIGGAGSSSDEDGGDGASELGSDSDLESLSGAYCELRMCLVMRQAMRVIVTRHV